MSKRFIATRTALGLVSVCILMPLIWTAITAFKSSPEVLTTVPKFFPKKLMFSNFAEVFGRAPFGRYYLNTAVFAFGLLAIQFVVIIPAAYAFARLEFKGRNILFFLFLGQMMITPQTLFFPNYLTILKLGLTDTVLAIMLPYFASGFGTFLLRQAFMTIPQELEDAAKIDGCGGLKFLWFIGVPIVRPTLLAFALLSLSYHWNEFFWPLIVTDTNKARVLVVGLTMFARQAESGAEWTLLCAGTLIVIFPLLVVFVLFQRRFIYSFMQSGIKG